MASANDTKAADGLVIPANIPGDDLKPENVISAADALDAVAVSYTTTADDFDVAWSGMPASFVAPGAETVYAGMSKPSESARTFAAKVGKVTEALRTYADSLASVKKTLDTIKADAEEFLTEFDAGNRVWMAASGTQEYEFDSKVSSGTRGSIRGEGVGGTDPLEYLRGRGETARRQGGAVEVRVHWLQSGDHIVRNNALMDRIADAYARVNALEVECANAINNQRDVCVAELTAVEAWQLKQGGDNAADLPWGRRADEDRNCSESFGNGIVIAGVGAVQGLGGLIGYNPIKNQFGDGEYALQAWAGTFTALGSLALYASNPLAPVLGALGVPVYSDATKNVNSMVMGLVAWETWATNPAEAAGTVLFNVGTLLIPGVNIAKGLSIVSKAGIATNAIAKVDRIASHFGDLFPGGKVPHVVVDAPGPNTRLPTTDFPDGAGGPRVHVDTPVRVDVPTDRADTGAPPSPERGDTGAPHAPDDVSDTPTTRPEDSPSRDGAADSDQHSPVDGSGGETPGGHVDGTDNPSGPSDGGHYDGPPPEDQARIENYQRLIDAQNPDGTPRYDEHVRRFFRGEIFNIENHYRYPVNELHVTKPGAASYSRVDSFVPDYEVLSRKNTQLSEIAPGTANHYLSELANKYGLLRDDILVADTPTNRRDLAAAGYDPDDYIGKPLSGQQILEVPAQKTPPPLDFLLRADERNVVVKDVDETMWVVSADHASVVAVRADGTTTTYPAAGGTN